MRTLAEEMRASFQPILRASRARRARRFQMSKRQLVDRIEGLENLLADAECERDMADAYIADIRAVVTGEPVLAGKEG